MDDEVFYSNKQLFEMFMKKFDEVQVQQNKLLLDLELTRKELRQYNDLRAQLAEVQKMQIETRNNCIYEVNNPDSPLNRLAQRLTEETSGIKKSIEELDKKVGSKEMISKGRESVGNGIIKWGGWLMSVILFAITLYRALSGN
jgi:(p)ppGpp synthase/HD superfamily hydrolase